MNRCPSSSLLPEPFLRMDEIYLDHAATTPVRPEVMELMLETMRTTPANPSSVHRAGQRARRALEAAREQAAEVLSARPADIIFTSGATEALNQALNGFVRMPGFRRLLVSPLEHKAVLAVVDGLAAAGTPVEFLVPEQGAITTQSLRQVDPGPGDVVVAMLVNNETGALTNIRHLANAAHRKGALLLCDITQGFGVEDVTVDGLQADAIVLSGHKFGGPRGAGLLWRRPGLELSPFILGGEQERGLRAGTSDLPAIAGLALAMKLAAAEQPELHRHLAELQSQFEERIRVISGTSIIGAGQSRSVKHSSVSVEGVDGDLLLMTLDAARVLVSIGSACSAGSLEPSHVLLALGLPAARARATVRFSFGAATRTEDVLEAADRFEQAVSKCRAVELSAAGS